MTSVHSYAIKSSLASLAHPDKGDDADDNGELEYGFLHLKYLVRETLPPLSHHHKGGDRLNKQ